MSKIDATKTNKHRGKNFVQTFILKCSDIGIDISISAASVQLDVPPRRPC